MNQSEFVEAVFRNEVNREIVERLPLLGLTDVWLVSGALFQSAWNTLSSRSPGYGINDYDIFYFDPDLSWEAEDVVIKTASRLFADLVQQVEIRNQARAHLWYPEKIGLAYSPLSSSTQAIERFLMTCAQVGIRRRVHGLAV